jgi:hypothetical protein
MSIWAKLKAIGLNIPKLKDITGIRFSSLIKIDRSIKIEGSTVVINLQRLSGKQKRSLKHIIRAEALDEAGAILDETSVPTVDAALEALPSIEETSRKFYSIIPPEDIPLLDACLFLRERYQAGVPVEDLKGQIVRVYGSRGRNLANLCSAGYLDDWFWPLYEEVLRAYPGDPASAKAKFQEIYSNIVNELPWTEFVSASATAAKVTEHIREKMKRNIQNGLRYLNVHALGKANVRKVVRILPDIQQQTGAIAVRVDQDTGRIFVRLEIPLQTSE